MVSQRYVLIWMVFAGLFCGFAVRMNLSMAITRMAYPPTVSTSPTNGSTSGEHEALCPMPDIEPQPNVSVADSDLIAIEEDDRFDWSQELQGVILSSFFWGYVITNIPGGMLAQKFGGKYVLASSVFFPGILTLLTPLCVELGGAKSLIGIRIALGFFQGSLFPSLSALMTAWIPLSERGALCSIAYAGSFVGSFAMTYSAGLLMKYFDGWHSVFYVPGVLSLAWTALFVFVCASDPESHPFIDESEQKYLQKELGQSEQKSQGPTPWLAMFTSAPVLALLLTSTAEDWGTNVIAIDLPKYLSDVLHFSVEDVGFYSSTPWILRMASQVFAGYFSDWLISGNRLSLTNNRKLFVFLASVFPAVFLVGASYAGCNRFLVVALFTLSLTLQGFITIPCILNPMDLSPTYAASLMGVVNAFSSATGIVAPTLVGLLTPNSLLSEWRLVIWITFVVHIVKTIVYTIWGSAKVQPWDTPTKDSEFDEQEMIALKSTEIEKNSNLINAI